MTIELRRITAGDTSLFHNLEPDVFDEAVDADRLRAYLASPGHLLVLAVDEGRVVGMCAGVVYRHPDKPSELFIDEVGTAARFRRRGAGQRMVREMLEWGREQGCAEAWVLTDPENVPANRLYRTAGGKASSPQTMYSFGL